MVPAIPRNPDRAIDQRRRPRPRRHRRADRPQQRHRPPDLHRVARRSRRSQRRRWRVALYHGNFAVVARRLSRAKKINPRRHAADDLARHAHVVSGTGDARGSIVQRPASGRLDQDQYPRRYRSTLYRADRVAPQSSRRHPRTLRPAGPHLRHQQRYAAVDAARRGKPTAIRCVGDRQPLQ